MQIDANLVFAAALAGSVSIAHAAGGPRDNMHVTNAEIAQLPRFCWAQMEVPNATGPEYNFPYVCGPGMNHYCGGLVYAIRAKGPAAKGKPVGFLNRALVDIRYTESAMKDYPNCPYRDHVLRSKAEVEGLLKLYGKPR
jgi:hypothetical protein